MLLNTEKILQTKDNWIYKLIPYFPKFIQANHLTITRLLLVIPVTWLVLEKRYILFLLFFTIAWSTDLLDGPLARFRKQISNFGIIIDPIADKLLTFVPLYFLANQQINSFLVWTLMLAEFSVLFFSWLYIFICYLLKVKIKMGATFIGKTKAVIFFITVFTVCLNTIINNQILTKFAEGLLIVALILLIANVFLYIFKKA